MYIIKQDKVPTNQILQPLDGRKTQQLQLKDNRECVKAHRHLVQGVQIKRISPSININSAVQQRKKRLIQPQRKDTLQCETKVNFDSQEMEFNGAKAIVGKDMKATLDPDDPVTGSEPDIEEQGELIESINTFFKKETFIRGHLLNADLGGPGLAYNLFPISSKANHNHSLMVEEPLKTALARAKFFNKDINYNVSVAFDCSADEGVGKLFSIFTCEACYVDKDDTTMDNCIIPKIQIISDVERLKCLTRRGSEIFNTINESTYASPYEKLSKWEHYGRGHTKSVNAYEETEKYLINKEERTSEQVIDADENIEQVRLVKVFDILFSNNLDEILKDIIPTMPLDEEIGRNIRVLRDINDKDMASVYMLHCLQTNDFDLSHFMNNEGEKSIMTSMSTELDVEDEAKSNSIQEALIIDIIERNRKRIIKKLYDLNMPEEKVLEIEKPESEVRSILEDSALKEKFFSIINECLFSSSTSET